MGIQNQQKIMQAEVRKKKKTEIHKVVLCSQGQQKSMFKIDSITNAYFPYEPYPEQSIFIGKIHESIKNGHNALIQSPTGTGKTLCMLVGGLSSLCSMTQDQKVKVPKIYYLTRTHSQITQVVNELKRLNWYQCKVNIIASRQHLCINKNLKQLKGRALDRGCQQMCKQKLCKYKEETTESTFPFKQWLTIEELCQKGTKKNFCPFYSSKMSTERCEITIMPFNYLLDWGLFEHNNFNLKNSVIIFDEAHNVDSLAEQGSSLQIDTQMLGQALIQINNLQQSSKCRYLHKKFENDYDNAEYQFISKTKSLLMRMISVLKQSVQQRNSNDFQQMLLALKRITNFVDHEWQFPGIDLNNYDELLYILDKVRKIFGQKKLDSQQFDIFYQNLNRIIKMVDSTANNMEDYFMYMGPKSVKHFTIKFNCLNASFTFLRLLEEKPRSIILCSGTMGPFQILQGQLGFKFQTKLKIPSFIKPNQVCVGIIQRSLKNDVRYQFSFQNKNRDNQYESLCLDFRQIQKVVPNGIVVAFSTYQIMQNFIKYCIGFSKEVFFQSKNQSTQKIYAKFCKAAYSQKGAFLFIVMKGKFSEGINFNDELCRCLIVVGVPFLPPHEYKIVRKKNYLTQKFDRETADQWYYSQTFKSVNQVIGRVIRSKKDYGCVLLFDQRYARKDIQKELPLWFTSNLSITFQKNFINQLRNFFKQQNWNVNNDNSKKSLHQTSFQIALSKTILANEQAKNLSLQKLLNIQTPIKVKKGKLHNKRNQKKSQKDGLSNKKKKHLTLNIISDNQSEPQKIQVNQEQQKQQRTKQEKSALKINNQGSKIKRQQQQYPWLSLDYFYGDQIRSCLDEQKTRKMRTNSAKMCNQNQLNEDPDCKNMPMVTMQTNKRRKIKYM